MSERSKLNSLERLPARRLFLIGGAVTLLCAPSVLRASSLMPVRGIIYPIEQHQYGFVERIYVHSNLPMINKLQHAGLNAYEIAAMMNIQGRTSRNGESWNADRVLGVLTRDRNIRQEDAIRRAEKILGR